MLRTNGGPYNDALRAYVLPQVLRVQQCLQSKLFAVPKKSRSGTVRVESNCRKNHPSVWSYLCRFILPRTDNFLGYLCRMTDSEEWGKRRKIGNVRVNQIIDFQDTLNIWRKGTVVAVSKENQVLMARVKITIKGDDFFETVEANSRRIAPFTFFTKKKYLEDFVPSLA